MTCLYLVRHGATDAIGRCFTGRQAGVELNATGRRQAQLLADRLRDQRIAAIFSSPCDRARQTAEIIAAVLQLTVEERDAFNEVDIGQWCGVSFEELEKEKDFRLFNSARSLTRPPSGELALEVQSRAVTEVLRIVHQCDGCSVLIVTHADVIRAALAYFLGIPVDLARRLTVDLASVSVLEIAPDHVQVVKVNN